LIADLLAYPRGSQIGQPPDRYHGADEYHMSCLWFTYSSKHIAFIMQREEVMNGLDYVSFITMSSLVAVVWFGAAWCISYWIHSNNDDDNGL